MKPAIVTIINLNAFAFVLGMLAAASCTPAALTALGPAFEAAITAAGKIVKEHTGRDISEYPTTCEYEFNPRGDEMLLLCTVKLARPAR